jgi:hypothetical protein
MRRQRFNSGKGGEGNVFYHGPFGLAQRVCWCSGSLCQLSQFLYWSSPRLSCVRGGNAQQRGKGGEVHVFYHGPFGLTYSVCVGAVGALCQLSLLWQPPSLGRVAMLPRSSTYRSAGLSGAMGEGTHPT